MNAVVPELNRASSNNTPPLIPQLQTPVSPADRLANSGFSTFTDTLAKVQAEAAGAKESDNGTPSSSILTKPLQIGMALASPVTLGDSESLTPQNLISQVKKGVYSQTQVSDKSDETSPLPIVPGSAEVKSKPRKESGTTNSLPGAAVSALPALGEVVQSAVGITTASPNPAATQSEASMPASASSSRAPKIGTTNADLAFALKIQSNNSSATGATQPLAKTDTTPAQPDQAGAASVGELAAPLAGTTALTAEKTNGNPDTKADATDLTSLLASGNHDSSSSPVTQATSKAAGATVAPVDKAQQPTSIGQPLKTVQVQIMGSNNQSVDLRLVEKSGALTMSVRSSDGTLTRALQQHLPDLTSKLSDQQMRTEWWRPDVQKVDSSQKQSSSSDSNDSAASQDKGNQGKSNSGQQGERNTDEPDWLEELTNLRKSNQNGTQYSWHL